MNLHQLCNDTISVAKQAGAFIKSERTQNTTLEIETKSHNSFVTKVDKGAEEIIVEGLKRLIPEAGFIAEEGTSQKKGEHYNWIIDPLDGTTNFIHNIPVYAVSIALMKDSEVVLGVVYEINLDECFYAWKGGGAFLNNQPIHVTNTNQLKDSFLATGFPYYDFERMKSYVDLLGYFVLNTQGLRRLGSAATDLAYVACGRFDAYYEYSLSPWDVAAGSLIVQEAGGVVTRFNNDNDFIFGQEIVASNGPLHPTVTDAIGTYFVR